jgi:transposase-like protein
MKKIAPSELRKQALREFYSGGWRSGELRGGLTEFIRLSVQKTLQEMLEAEQTERLGREPYERDGNPGVYRNGYEPGHLKTSEGVIEVSKPQIRGLGEPYRSEIWANLKKVSESLSGLVLEMYADGMSTRDVEAALEKALGGFVLSKSSVSRMTESLTEEYELFRSRDLSGFDVVYFFLDAIYEPLREFGCRTGVMCCWGYLLDGRKVLLDMTCGNGESYESTMDFLRGMVKRGLRTPLTVTTDGARGLIKAVEAIWPKSLRIRCWFHKMQNIQAKVPASAWSEFRELVRDMRDAPSFEEGQARLQSILDGYSGQFPEACRCLAEDAEASLNHLHVPPRHRSYVRTTNLVERSFEEQRRRTKIIPHLWDEKSMLKLVFAVLIRVSDRWSKQQFGELEQVTIIQLRNRILGETMDLQKTTSRTRRRSHKRVA